MTYKPLKSYGGWVGLILGLLIFGFTIWGINFALDDSDRTLRIILYVPTYLFLIIYIYLIIGAFNMRYKIEEDALVIIWGFYKKRIEWEQFNEIFEVKGEPNLFPFLTAAWPGYMVGLYSGKAFGSIRMFATHIQNGFIYIKAKNALLGITPADQKMVEILLNKTGKSLQTIDMDKMSHEQKGESIKEDHFFNLYHKLNVIFLVVFAAYLGIFFPGSGAPKFVILLLVLALALFIFNVSNAKRLYQFSSQGANTTLLVGLAVTGIFMILSLFGVSLR
ncbi:MAG: hypothetical protein CVU90_10480 [Firmicutes bacterium HGW-Firmicutes-15]|nr:MAG: hypothetical protein CVU90_10480 [Firmicutes bacterium HGW-Firmicutes-15]